MLDRYRKSTTYLSFAHCTTFQRLRSKYWCGQRWAILTYNRSPNSSLPPRDMPSLLRDCPVGDTNFNVKFATKPQRISCPHMHNLFAMAMTRARQKIMETGRQVDRPLTREELPFELGGTERSRRYYTDVEETPGGVLTWESIYRAYEGLYACVFKRQIYFEIHFEIWQGFGPREVQLGVGEFGLYRDGPAELEKPAAAQ